MLSTFDCDDRHSFNVFDKAAYIGWLYHLFRKKIIMNKEQLLLKKLDEISNVLKDTYHNTDELGVLSGRAGIALFQFYYSKLLQEESHANIGVEILSSIIEEINKGYNFHTFCSGIAGAAWAIELLQEEEYIDLDCDKLLSGLDHFLMQSIEGLKGDQNFYDFLHGILGIGYYFLKRYTNTKSDDLKEHYKKILFTTITLLKERAQIDNHTAKWKSYLIRDEELKGYNLGLAHGNTSIANFLSRLAEYKDFKDEVHRLLDQSITYILSLKNENHNSSSSFPNWITSDHQKSDSSRLAWCYGDLGIAITVWRAGKLLNNETYKNQAIQILKHAAKRKDLAEAGVKDAGLCHGAYGIMHIYNYMYKETQEPIFKEAVEFWMDQALAMAVHQDGYAGYMQWRGGDNPGWIKEINLLVGIAGIGLSIISYLAPFKTKWDECLLIG